MVLRVTDREEGEGTVSDDVLRVMVNRRTKICKQKLRRNSEWRKEWWNVWYRQHLTE